MRIKKYIVILIGMVLIFASFPLAAFSEENDDNVDRGKFSTKDEVIYGKLDANGNVKNMYVVNSFHITKHGEISDYGVYNDIRNLTDLSDIIMSGSNKVQFEANEDEFYYQGELMNQPLPWDVAITYRLDGQEINPAELAGKSGQLDIQITTSANKQVDQVFFENYLLQIMLTFDPLVFQDIHAPKGIEANEGKNKLITFSVMPEQEDVLVVSTKVTDLEMEPIEISAIPANIALEDPDTDELTKEFQTLADAIADIHSGVGKLRNGTSELSRGSRQLNDGSNDYLQGMNTINDSSGELVSGSAQILNVLNQIGDAIEEGSDLPDFDVEDLEQLPDVFREIAKELRKFAKNFNDFNDAIEQIPDLTISEKELNELKKALKEAGANEEVLDQLIETYYIAKQIQDFYEDVPDELKRFVTSLADRLEEAANEMEASLDQLEQLGELENFGMLASEYEVFHNGLVSYTDGVGQLTSSYKEIDNGISSIAKGTSELHNGVSELHDGTKELHDETKDLPDQLKSEVDKMLDDYDFSDFEPTSFVSDKNKKIGVVQFVLRTESIEVEEVDDQPVEVEEKKGIWQRFLDLFR